MREEMKERKNTADLIDDEQRWRFGAVFWLNFHHARRAKSDEPGSASFSAHGGARNRYGATTTEPTLLLQLLATGSAAGRTRRSRISRGIGADGWMRCLGYGAAAAAAAELVTDGKLHDVRRMFYDRCAVG